MTEITFYDLVKIFGVAQATDAVESHVDRQYAKLCQESPRTEDTETRIRIFKEDPFTFVQAMALDDSGFNKTRPVQPIYGDTGPMKDPQGKYNVKCSNGSFEINVGDYLILSTDNKNNHQNIEVMSQNQFKTSYVRSENVSSFKMPL